MTYPHDAVLVTPVAFDECGVLDVFGLRFWSEQSPQFANRLCQVRIAPRCYGKALAQNLKGEILCELDLIDDGCRAASFAGRNAAAHISDDVRWAKLEQRIGDLEGLIRSQAMVATSEFATAATYAPPVFRLTEDNGAIRSQRYSPYWHDREVRSLIIQLHRQTTLNKAVAEIASKVGRDRAPGRSVLQRIWKQLDQVRAAA